MIIRKAQLKDIFETSKLEYELNFEHSKFDSYYTLNKKALSSFRDMQKKHIYSAKSLFLVAEDKDRIVGYVIGSLDIRPPVFVNRKRGYINGIFILKKYRRSGVSRKFMKELFKWFKSKKVKYIELSAHVKNPVALKVWNSHKFQTFVQHMRFEL